MPRGVHDCGHEMTWKRGATPLPLPTLCTIRSWKITTAVTVAPKQTGDLKSLPPNQYLHHNPHFERHSMPVALATAAWNLPRLATALAYDGGILMRKFHDCGHGMTWKRGATPLPLPTLYTIRSWKITTVVTVAPKQTGD